MKIDLSNKVVWQIGSGDDTRNYANVFFDFGVALVGPGDPGKHGEEPTEKYYQANPKVKNWGAELAKIQPGHWIVIRKGRKQILGIGEVIGEYDYSEMFEDVEGWDLQHFIKVKWFKPVEEIRFSGTPLVMSTIAACNHSEVLDRICNSEFKREEKKLEVKYDTELPKKLDPEDLPTRFIDSGIRIQDAENIANTIRRIIQLADWYFKNDFKASEHELRTFLVVPLLISLGWSEQKIKVEYQNMDISLFEHPFRPNGKKYTPSPFTIIETKKYDNGLAFTNKQVERYASKYPECEYFITTNGYRYRFFTRDGNQLKAEGYINLLNIRERDLLDQNIDGAFKTLLKMSNLSATVN